MLKVEEQSIDIMNFVLVKPDIMKYLLNSLNPVYGFKADQKIWTIRSESMDEAFYITDDLFKIIRFCEECYFILKEEKNPDYFYREVERHVQENADPSTDFF